MIETVEDLIKRLSNEASSLEDFGQSELACGIQAAIRIIRDELNPFDAIGGDTPPAQNQIPRELVDELTQVKNENKALIAKSERFRSIAATMEGFRHEIAEKAERKHLEVPRYLGLRADVHKAEKMIDALPRCKKCSGKGVIKPMFHDLDCPDCFGSGRDLEVFDKLVVGQQELIRHQKVLMSALLHEVYTTRLAEIEKVAISMDDFYRTCKTNLRLD